MAEFEVEPSKQGVEFVGPFSEWRAVLNGYRVPRLSGRSAEGITYLTLDNRFGIDIPERYATQVVWMIANAMAIGADYSCHGENCQPINEFKVKMTGVIIHPDHVELESLETN